MLPHAARAITTGKPHILLTDCLTEPEWLEWYLLSPEERWQRSMQLWPEYLALGGSLEPEVDFQSPFYTAEEYAEFNARHLAKLGASS